MSELRLFEMPGHCWPVLFDHGPFIDRSETPVDDYLKGRGVEFVGDPLEADYLIRKGELTSSDERIPPQRGREIFVIGEPRELSPACYRAAIPARALVVAPGTEFRRMYFGRPWSDPQIDDWHTRKDRFVWIGRPIPHRLAIAKQLLEWGIPLDVYSRRSWPLPCWRGPAEDDVETARAYKFRIACENSNTFLYHSEKLFTGIRSGCVTFYWGDPDLDLRFVQPAFLPLTRETVSRRYELAPKVLEGMSQFMFSSAWEVYSVRRFIDTLVDLLNELR